MRKVEVEKLAQWTRIWAGFSFRHFLSSNSRPWKFSWISSVQLYCSMSWVQLTMRVSSLIIIVCRMCDYKSQYRCSNIACIWCRRSPHSKQKSCSKFAHTNTWRAGRFCHVCIRRRAPNFISFKGWLTLERLNHSPFIEIEVYQLMILKRMGISPENAGWPLSPERMCASSERKNTIRSFLDTPSSVFRFLLQQNTKMKKNLIEGNNPSDQISEDKTSASTNATTASTGSTTLSTDSTTASTSKTEAPKAIETPDFTKFYYIASVPKTMVSSY